MKNFQWHNREWNPLLAQCLKQLHHCVPPTINTWLLHFLVQVLPSYFTSCTCKYVAPTFSGTSCTSCTCQYVAPTFSGTSCTILLYQLYMSVRGSDIFWYKLHHLTVRIVRVNTWLLLFLVQVVPSYCASCTCQYVAPTLSGPSRTILLYQLYMSIRGSDIFWYELSHLTVPVVHVILDWHQELSLLQTMEPCK